MSCSLNSTKGNQETMRSFVQSKIFGTVNINSLNTHSHRLPRWWKAETACKIWPAVCQFLLCKLIL